jgi:hypothetical protein
MVKFKTLNKYKCKKKTINNKQKIKETKLKYKKKINNNLNILN